MCHAPHAGAGVDVLAAALDELPEALRGVASASGDLQGLTERIVEDFRDELREVTERTVKTWGDALGTAATRGTLTDAVQDITTAATAADVADLLDEAGFSEMVAAHLEAHAGVLEGAVQVLEATGLPRTALGFDVEMIESLNDLGATRWMVLGEDMALATRRVVLESAVGGADLDGVIGLLREELDRTQIEAVRDARTMLNTYSRTAQDGLAKRAGIDTFLYVGPVDAITRDFCRPLVGKVLTREQVQSLDNGQLGNPLRTGGGHQCRHTWAPTPKPKPDWPMATPEDLAKADQSAERARRAKRRAEKEAA